MHSLIGYCVLVASSLTRIYMLLGAVAISMWLGIHLNLVLAGLLYLALTVPLRALARRAAAREPG